MIRYRLDDLGWFQFEWLAQSLLKAELGIGVESWGGHADRGVDVFSDGLLRFPSKDLDSEGPFVFQVKFVENANAAGAKPNAAVLSAVGKESRRIADRISSGDWGKPRHYVFVTNVCTSANLREKIASTLSSALPECHVHTLGGGDICDLLDQHETLRRSFPQLLSLRDLDQMLRQAVNKDILERSEAGVFAAREVAQVFVPTEPYSRAWKVLNQHSFCVLEGPPEMGKTAIAWMIGLTQLADNWELVVCTEPDDFFAVHSKDHRQVFVADDAFGRTEYDPARGKCWERDLHRIFPRLDRRHWLIWTSRKHILAQAVERMDLQGHGRHFPSPGAVTVIASRLSIKEKAVMLYRHAKVASLEECAKTIVREYAESIVRDDYFTPERIRRFVVDRLPELSRAFDEGQLVPEQVAKEITEAIRDPTKRMRTSFRALPGSHQRMLVALLEADAMPTVDRLRRLYEQHFPACDRGPFQSIVEGLAEAFVRLRRKPARSLDEPSRIVLVDWIHPSYRDLVVEELASNPALRKSFLDGMGLEGIKLALSEPACKGISGAFLLIASEDEWRTLKNRCLALAEESARSDQVDLLEILSDAAKRPTTALDHTRLTDIIRLTCLAVHRQWNQPTTVLSARDLVAYCKASSFAAPLPPIPDLRESWETAVAIFRRQLEGWDSGYELEIDELRTWVDLADVVARQEPRFLVQARFPDSYKEDLEILKGVLESELGADIIQPSYEDLVFQAEQLDYLAEVTEDLSRLLRSYDIEMRGLVEQAQARARQLLMEAEENDPDPPDDYYDYYSESVDAGYSFDVHALFSDL